MYHDTLDVRTSPDAVLSSSQRMIFFERRGEGVAPRLPLDGGNGMAG